MRVFSTLTAILFVNVAAFGQQALWGGQSIVSPEINTDNTVTFRFQAPEAEKVQLTGDFLPTKKTKTPFGEADMPDIAELKKGDDGVWVYTTSQPLASELYSYSFVVDGLKVTDRSTKLRIEPHVILRKAISFPVEFTIIK